MVSVRVPGFLPSTSGLRFTNRFPPAPFWRLHFRNLLALEVGNVANGLCGGMTFVAADLHNAGAPRPDDTAAPDEGNALRERIKRRQVDSFAGGRLPLRFFSLGLPFRPAEETPTARRLARFGIDLHSRTFVMVAQEWPEIRRRLDAGGLVAIGLVRSSSANPFDLTSNHQVLAYGYDLEGGLLVLRIYDPNWPDDDDVTITLDVSDANGDAAPAYSKADGPLHAFFRAPYRDPA
jgi:hypothetical protein